MLDLATERVRLFFAGGVALLLMLNCAGVHGVGAHWWASPGLLVGAVALFVVGNGLLLPARFVSLANIFLLLLCLFHLGYYVPVRLGIMRGLPHMPPVHGDGAASVMVVFCGAILALELGYLLAASLRARVRRNAGNPEEPLYAERGRICGATEWRKTVLHCGWIISGLCCAALLVFVIQTGGPSATAALSYSDLFAYFTVADSRFALTCMWYAPIGLLLWRVGLNGCAFVPGTCVWWAAAVALLTPFLRIGARGPAFLFILGLIYTRHRYERRFRPVQMVAAAALLMVAAPVIASYRNVQPGARARALSEARVGVGAFLSEIGSTYRPYYGIVEMMQSGQQEYLRGRSYLAAAGTLVPNLGAVDKALPDEYYRTNTWFNYRLSPVDDANGVGIGCSMIAEQYANFGYFGVLGAFLLAGGAIVWLETQAVVLQSVWARAVLAVVFVPLCWYIRDDIFGTLRMCVWPVAALMVVRVLRLPLSRNSGVQTTRRDACD